MASIEAALTRQEREDWRAALVAAVIANVNRDPKRGRPFQPRDFMPRRARAGAQTPEQQVAILRAITIALGGEIRERHGG